MAFKSKAVPNVGTTLTQVTDTVASNTAHTIIGFSVANVSTANITISAKLTKANASYAFLVKGATVLPGGAIVIVGGDQKVVLEAGDSISVNSSAVDSSDCLVSYLADAN